MVYLPEPLFALVLAHLTDGEPTRRILRRSGPALGRALGRDWGETRRLVDIVAYTLRRKSQHKGNVRMLMIVGDEPSAEVRAACFFRRAQPRATYPLKYTWEITQVLLRLHLVHYDYLGCSYVSCEIVKSNEYYPLDGDKYGIAYDAVFVCGDLFIDRDDMRSVHNGQDRFVI